MISFEVSDRRALSERLEVGARLSQARDQVFRPGACIAAGGWTAVGDIDELVLSDADSLTAVALLTVPQRIWDMPGRSTLQANPCAMADPRVLSFTAALGHWSRDMCRHGRLDWASRGVRVTSPRNAEGLVTDDPATHQYIGLHLDNWDNEPIHSRNESRNRLCVNLGTSARHLLLTTVSITEMILKLYSSESTQARWSMRDISRYARVSATDVIRIRVEPGEGYVAPTEWLVHEGQVAVGQLDITATFLGYHVLEAARPHLAC